MNASLFTLNKYAYSLGLSTRAKLFGLGRLAKKLLIENARKRFNSKKNLPNKKNNNDKTLIISRF